MISVANQRWLTQHDRNSHVTFSSPCLVFLVLLAAPAYKQSISFTCSALPSPILAGMPSSSRMALVLSSLPAGAKTIVAASILFIALFHAGLPFFRTSKQRSWVLTGLGSAAMTIASLPFVTDFARQRGDVALLMQAPWISETACRVFQAYLVW